MNLAFVCVRRAIVAVLVGVLVCGIVLPQPAYAQFGFVGLFAAINGVLNTINTVIRGLLATANGILSGISSLFQAFWNLLNTVVYPPSLIARAQALASSMIAQFRGLLASIFNIRVNSAQLPNPTALESVMRNRSASDLGQLGQAYVQTYRPVPAPTDAHPMERDLIDMDDAVAMAQLKTLKAADAIADQTIAAADLIENEAQQVAPGTAAYLSAAGIIAALENQAIMQKMVAGQMRQEAARLAHENMVRKRNTMLGRDLRQGIGDLFQRQ